MASVKNLKKDINFVLGDIIEAVYLYEMVRRRRYIVCRNFAVDWTT